MVHVRSDGNEGIEWSGYHGGDHVPRSGNDTAMLWCGRFAVRLIDPVGSTRG